MSAPGGTGEEAQRTALYPEHVAAGARMVEFAGWIMPVSYTSIVEEHLRVRSAVGLFDVSHMGELEVWGRGAEAFLNRLTTNDVTRLKPGRAHYTCLAHARGGVLDDAVVCRLAEDRFLMVVNASNREKIRRHLEREGAARSEAIEMADRSRETSLLSLQGPRALEVLGSLTSLALEEMRFYACARGEVADLPALVARTGYTGEDGFEIYVGWEEGRSLWRRLLAAGASHGILPVGLGARDTLRLEARMALYGHELAEDISPLEAGLERWVKLDKGEFVGREALLAEEKRGPRRGIVGFTTAERVVPRPGAAVLVGGRRVGAVTSGTFSPTLRHGIALALVQRPLPEEGTTVEVELRGQRHPGQVVSGPFYKRRKEP